MVRSSFFMIQTFRHIAHQVRVSGLLVLLTGILYTTAEGQDSDKESHPHKVLFLGNSITLHGPNKDLDWSGNWGMAATAKEKDYVHLVAKGIEEWNAEAPDILVKNIASFERNLATYELETNLQEAKKFEANLIILAIGENIPHLKTDADSAALKTAVLKLINYVKAPDARIVIRSPFWHNAAKETVLKSIASETGAIYVDISGLDKNEENFARAQMPYKHPGVGNHPSDKGMKAIADAILKAIPD